MQYICVQKIFPDWNFEQDFFVAEHELAMYFDVSLYTHALDSNSTSFQFDDVTYNKGASIIRMLKQIVDCSSNMSLDFFSILGIYIQENLYSTTSTNGLLTTLNRETGMDLKSTLIKWIIQPGFPLVHVAVNRTSQYRYSLTFQQSKFSLWKSSKSEPAVWPIYLYGSLILSDEESMKSKIVHVNFGLFDRPVLEFPYESINPWRLQSVILNPNRTAFYRASYASHVSPILSLEFLEVSDRSGFISDEVALLLSTRTPIYKNWLIDFQQKLGFMKAETSTSVWQTFIVATSQLEIAMRNTDFHTKLLRWLQMLLLPILQQLSWLKISHALDPIKRELFELALKINEPYTINDCLIFFNSPQKHLDPVLQVVIWKGAVRFGPEDNFWRLLDTTKSKINLDVIESLASVREPKLQKFLLEHYRDDKYSSGVILKQFLNHGHYKIVWGEWKAFGFGSGSRFERELESCVVQFQCLHLIKEAAALRFAGSKRGVERAIANFKFRKIIT